MKIIFTCLILTISLSAQQSKLSKYVNYISAYIGSEDFNSLKNKIGDIAATDSIYSVAAKAADFHYSEALLALMFATVPYREVPVQIPLINFVLNYPLLSADEETFHKKNNKLPKYLFLDSPSSDYGDKDKLAHFFGSAFLSYESRFFDLGELIGYFVEAFEESFKVQSAIDYRDLDVNEYGRLFGKILKEDKTILPSQIIFLRSLRYIRIIL
ncbi:MAG: hypothetical protein KGZ85_07660 [Ignavibacterium sp.]|nr:hypothetical protein [Ignavibacterium sp.]